MTDTVMPAPMMAQRTKHFDVLIVGAGISGIGGAYHLTQQCPGRALSCSKRRKVRRHVADPPLSRHPLRQRPVHFRLSLQAMDRRPDRHSGRDPALHGRGNRRERPRAPHPLPPPNRVGLAGRARTICGRSTRSTLDTGEPVRFTCNFLWMCQGYYRHSEGYTPEWRGMDRFKGIIVHPQKWPEDLDYADKRVVVIGSGATAATLIPAIATDCAHVTMLQRSPTFFRTGRNAIEIADELRELQVDEAWIHEIVRRKILYEQSSLPAARSPSRRRSRRSCWPGCAPISAPTTRSSTDFTPRYRPWRQRIAFMPDGDFLQAIAAGKASVVTDEIESFTETGIQLKSGKMLDADIIVTATGFNLSVLGDIDVHDRRQAAGLLRHGDLSRHDVHRRAEHGLGVRLFPGKLDVARRPRRRLRVPPSQSHEGDRGAAGRGAAAAGRQGHAAPAVDRPGELQSGLHDARHALAAEARRQTGVAAYSGLLDREG